MRAKKTAEATPVVCTRGQCTGFGASGCPFSRIARRFCRNTRTGEKAIQHGLARRRSVTDNSLAVFNAICFKCCFAKRLKFKE